jgi:hypothetical protein
VSLNYNDAMVALRYAGLLAVAVWVGGALTLGAIAAPAIFEAAAARQTVDGRLLAGAIFGEILRRFHHVSYACGVVVLASLAARGVLGPRPHRFAVRLGVAVVMLGAALYSGFVVSPSIARLQHSVAVAPSSLPDSDPRRAEFGRLHATSTGLQLAAVLGGLVLMFWELRDHP